jgi:SAM-dependent methyltransferase
MAAALPLNASLLEIGSGTGRAPRLFTRRGYDITYIEPLAEMATISASDTSTQFSRSGPHPESRTTSSSPGKRSTGLTLESGSRSFPACCAPTG